jgi:hypothetical protein
MSILKSTLKTSVLAAAAVAGIGLALPASATPFKINPNVGRIVRPIHPIPHLRLCPDPAIRSITMRRVRIGGRYYVRIVATLTNRGLGLWRSGPRQQIFSLTVTNGRRHLVRSRDVRVLRRGGTVALAVLVPVSRRPFGHARFVRAQARFSLDPDIYIDANPSNNDCNQRNNQMTRGFRV